MTQPPAPDPYLNVAPLSPSDERLWSTLTHVGGIFFSFIPALVVYLVFKDRGPFVRAHSAAALNFQLTWLIVYLIGIVTSLILVGVFVLIAAGILAVVFPIIAAVTANQGRPYTYPLSIRFVD